MKPSKFHHLWAYLTFAVITAATLHAEHGLRRETWQSLSPETESNLAKERSFLGLPMRLVTNPAFYTETPQASVLDGALSSKSPGQTQGARLRGYLVAPSTGDYTFWDNGSGTVAVYLSTDENPTGKRLIVAHKGRELDQPVNVDSPQKSPVVSLLAGKKYYLEVLYTSDAYQDGLDLRWSAPGDVRMAIPSTVLEAYVPPVRNPAGLTREFFPEIPGDKLTDLTGAASFYRAPATTDLLTTSTFSGLGKNYGVRLRGYLTPPATGEYFFWESAGGPASVSITTDDNSTAIRHPIRLNDRSNKVEVAFHNNGYTAPAEWGKYRNQGSNAVKLIAGKRYYFEAIYKAGEKADHLTLAWQVPGGQRELIPLSVLESYRRAETDLDDDGMPDALERTYGMDPADASDADGDVDGDGIFNDEEIRAGSNPNVRDSVPGIVLDDLWKDAPGEKLDQRAFQIAYTRKVSVRSANVATLVYHGGGDFVRRIRGYIIPPTDGDYSFWLAANTGESSFSFSTTTSKFDRQILAFAPMSGFGRMDDDPSQKTAPVNLKAGQKYYFEVWQKAGKRYGAPFVNLSWQIPGEERKVIAARYLASYPGEANDQDDDDLADDWERANGLSATDDGRSPNSKEGFYGDLDGDGLTNSQERALRTKANVADSDEDGLSDGDEYLIHSDPLFVDMGSFTSTLPGDAYSASLGGWEKKEKRAQQTSRRGWVSYPLTIPKSGVYALKISVSSRAGGDLNEAYDFRISINGVPVSYQTGYMLENGQTFLAVLTPWLNTGEANQCEVFVDNSYNYRRISVDELKILAAGGADANSNGIPNWVEGHIRDNNGFDQRVIQSQTSPAVVEGRAHYTELAKTNGVVLNKAPNGRFFAEVPLTADTPKRLEFAFENGALTQSATVHWQPTNLAQQKTNTLTVRQGDSLLITAYRNFGHPEKESYSLTMNGTSVAGTGDRPTPVVFPTAGVQVMDVNLQAGNGAATSRRFTVNVIPRVNMDSPLCVTEFRRYWTHNALPDGAELQLDDSLIYWREKQANTYTLITDAPQNQPLLVRYGKDGPILGSGEVRCVRVRSDDYTGYLLDGYVNGMMQIRLPVVVTGDMGGSEIRCRVMIGGVIFTDGSTTNSIFMNGLDEFGVGNFLFLKSENAHSACHRLTLWENGAPIAGWN